MSDQGRHDAEDRPDRTRTKRWKHDDKCDAWRDGWRAALECCRETMAEKGTAGLEAMLERTTR